jgi:hypothetical protein
MENRWIGQCRQLPSLRKQYPLDQVVVKTTKCQLCGTDFLIPGFRRWPGAVLCDRCFKAAIQRCEFSIGVIRLEKAACCQRRLLWAACSLPTS